MCGRTLTSLLLKLSPTGSECSKLQQSSPGRTALPVALPHPWPHNWSHSAWELEPRWPIAPQWLSRVCLSVTPWTAACQAPPSRGFSRQEHCSGWPCPPPGHLPDPGIEPASPALAGGLYHRAIWDVPPRLAAPQIIHFSPERKTRGGVGWEGQEVRDIRCCAPFTLLYKRN